MKNNTWGEPEIDYLVVPRRAWVLSMDPKRQPILTFKILKFKYKYIFNGLFMIIISWPVLSFSQLHLYYFKNGRKLKPLYLVRLGWRPNN